jgi:hypothetical protein
MEMNTTAGTQAQAEERAVLENVLGGGVARRGGLQRRNAVSTMEVRSVRTQQSARERKTP